MPGRILTILNILSAIRLVLVPVFLYPLLARQAYGWSTAILMFSGTSDWADGKIARLVANQSSRLGSCWIPCGTASTWSPFHLDLFSPASCPGGS